MGNVSTPERQMIWQPFGTYFMNTGISFSWFSMGGFSTRIGKAYRIDMATLIIDYHATDLNCWADMGIDPGTGTPMPFLSVEANPVNVSNAPNFSRRWMAQLTNPFTIAGNFGVLVQSGVGGFVSTSTIFAMVSMSQAWPLE